MPQAAPLVHFREQYSGPVDHYLGWHDGYEADLKCLDALDATDRRQAETELLANLRAGRADPRTIIGLGHLRRRAALPLLHEYLLNVGNYALRAIAQTDPTALDQPQLQNVLQKAGEFQLVSLLVGLRNAFTLPQLQPETVAQVFGLLRHAQYLVRYQALYAVRQLHHLPKAALERSYDLDAIRREPVFKLLAADGHPEYYLAAQQLLRAEIEEHAPKK